VVALASSPPQAASRWLRSGWGWTVAAGLVILVGFGLRMVVGGGGVGDRSALVMTMLLGGAAWLAARHFGGPRAALVALAAVVLLVDIAALPPRNQAAYDDLEAFYGTDQTLSATLAVPGDLSVAITLLVEPVYGGTQPRFGLAGDVNGTPLQWTCAFQHGVQRLALGVPSGLLQGGQTADVRLHLSGSPARDGDYLVVYTSSRLGGFVISLDPVGSPSNANLTHCSSV
jgi:hypothetical protein